ncbi:nucleotidyltransferase family protein [Mesobacillus maritimus]|uniref:nucleotidyltransferase family protein n=1 Tax=Mesobacillus maritimus TaxID=1643336 RepID=UPI00203ABBC7|nr:nucleotidyltransferase family protein [Mesobacillus maritimus]MCM3669007.1 nucleotidyltransferase family protein [Mesobacillus maritimus]
MNRKFIEEQLLAVKGILQRKYGIKKLGIFGSFSRNQQTETSDLDILVEFEKEVGLEFLEIKFFLEDLLGIKVDLATEAMLKPTIREQVINEIIYIEEYEVGVSEKFKQKVEELVNRLEPKDKENNALYQVVKEICNNDFPEGTAYGYHRIPKIIEGTTFCFSKPGGQGIVAAKDCECGKIKCCKAFEDSQRLYERFQEFSSNGSIKRKEIIKAIKSEFNDSQWWSDNVKE